MKGKKWLTGSGHRTFKLLYILFFILIIPLITSTFVASIVVRPYVVKDREVSCLNVDYVFSNPKWIREEGNEESDYFATQLEFDAERSYEIYCGALEMGYTGQELAKFIDVAMIGYKSEYDSSLSELEKLREEYDLEDISENEFYELLDSVDDVYKDTEEKLAYKVDSYYKIPFSEYVTKIGIALVATSLLAFVIRLCYLYIITGKIFPFISEDF